MKYLEYTPLERINEFLCHVNLGERTIKGCLEAYSCKHTGTDRKLSFSLERELTHCGSIGSDVKVLPRTNSRHTSCNGCLHRPNLSKFKFRDLNTTNINFEEALHGATMIQEYLGRSSDSDSPSFVENFCGSSSRKTLVYLVLALYHMYPDYDFSMVNAHQFFAEESWDSFKQTVEAYIFDASKEWVEVNEEGSLLDTLYKALDEVVQLLECDIYSYNPDCEADPFLEKGAIWSFTFFFYNRKLKRVVTFRLSCLSNLVAEGRFYDEEDLEMFDDMDM